MTIEEQILAEFYNIISESKQEMYDRIAADRTRYITVAMENIRKEHNASAVMRTCDCFGIQDLYTIEKHIEYKVQHEIAKGASNWVDLHSYSEGDKPEIDCINTLKEKGYRIVATSPHAEKTVEELELDQPIALFFGTERKGISEIVEQHSDELVRLPMYGFTESFNISVSAALCLSQLRSRLDKTDIQWKLPHDEQVLLKNKWCTRIIRDGEKVKNEIRRRILEKE